VLGDFNDARVQEERLFECGRALGAAGYGRYAYLYAFIPLIASVSDLGAGMVVTREIAERPGDGARRLAEGIAQVQGLRIDAAKVRSNIVIFDCSGLQKTAVELCQELHRRGIWAQDTALYSVRLVTHMDVDRAGIERALAALKDLAAA